MAGNDFDYAKVPEDVKEAVNRDLEKNGYVMVDVLYASNHPGDANIFNVLAEKASTPESDTRFVKWRYNSLDGNLTHGHYELTKERAADIMDKHTHDVFKGSSPDNTRAVKPPEIDR